MKRKGGQDEKDKYKKARKEQYRAQARVRGDGKQRKAPILPLDPSIPGGGILINAPRGKEKAASFEALALVQDVFLIINFWGQRSETDLVW